VMEAMEGAACAHIAKLYDIPMIEVRSGSNFVGERNKSKWDVDLAAKQLGWVCAAI
jgi:futalosine hydrolase